MRIIREGDRGKYCPKCEDNDKMDYLPQMVVKIYATNNPADDNYMFKCPVCNHEESVDDYFYERDEMKELDFMRGK